MTLHPIITEGHISVYVTRRYTVQFVFIPVTWINMQIIKQKSSACCSRDKPTILNVICDDYFYFTVYMY